MKQQTKNIPKGYKMTELGPLPEEWKVESLGNVAEMVMGQSPPGSTYNVEGSGQVFLQGKAEFGNIYPKPVKYTTKPLKLAPKGSILISVRAPVGDTNIANMEYCIGRGLASLSLQNGDNQYLLYVLMHRKQCLADQGTGSTFSAINKRTLESFKIPLPPLPEQKKIASVLSAVQQAKEKTEGAIAALGVLKKSLMKHLFTYGPVPVNEAEKVELKDNVIGSIPSHWKITKFGDVAEFKNGINFSADQKGTTGTLTIDVLNMYGSGIYVDHSKLYRVNKEIPENYVLQNGDILLVRSSLKQEGVGWASLFEEDKEPVTFCGFIIRARLKDRSKLESEFLVNFLRTDKSRQQLISSSGRVAITNINQGMLGMAEIPLPPISEQQQIAENLATVDQKLDTLENEKQALDDLFRTLLHDLMTAKIRVN